MAAPPPRLDPAGWVTLEARWGNPTAPFGQNLKQEKVKNRLPIPVPHFPPFVKYFGDKSVDSMSLCHYTIVNGKSCRRIPSVESHSPVRGAIVFFMNCVRLCLVDKRAGCSRSAAGLTISVYGVRLPLGPPP